MMKLKNFLRNRPINSYLSSISKRIEKKSYRDATEMILLLVRNFGLEKELYSFIENKLNGLLYEDYYRFVKELMNQIEISETIIREFMKDDHREPLNRFTNFLTEYFLDKAQKYKKQRPPETLNCLKIALELKAGDVEISKGITEIKEKYSQGIKTKEIHHKEEEYFNKKVIEIKLNLTFEELCIIYNNKKWEEVVSLGRKMEMLGYNEETHPIKEKVEDANQFIIAWNYYKKGKKFFNDEDFNNATKFYKKALKLDPENLYLMSQLATAYNSKGENKKAQKTIERANALKPNDPNILQTLGYLYIIGEDFKKAEKVLEKTIDIDPYSSNDVYLHLALVYLQNNKLENVERLFENAIKKKGDDPELIYRYGLGCIYNDKFQKAINILKPLFEEHPNLLKLLAKEVKNLLNRKHLKTSREFQNVLLKVVDTESLYYGLILIELGKAYFDNKFYEEAESLIERLYEVAPDPKPSNILNFLGLIYSINKKYDNAEKILIKGRQLYPDNYLTLITLSFTYFYNSKFKKAEYLFKEALTIKPDDENTLFALGIICLEYRQFAKAAKYFVACQKIVPEDSIALRFLGIACWHQFNLEDAEKYFEKAKQNNAKDVDTLLHLYSLYLFTGRLDLAENALLEANSIEKNNPIIVSKLAILHLERGKIIEAERILLQIDEKHHSDPDVANAFGMLYASKSDYKRAVQWYKKGLMQSFRDAPILNNLALSYFGSGKLDLAIKFIKRAIDIDPEFLIYHEHYKIIMSRGDIGRLKRLNYIRTEFANINLFPDYQMYVYS